MATYRTKKNKNNPYVMLNKLFLEDPRISYKAKGLLARLLSKPDDWVVYEIELTKAAKDGRDSVRSALKELTEAGYIRRNRERDEKGMYRQAEYEVHELPLLEQEGEEAEGEYTPVEKMLGAFAAIGATKDPTPEVKEMAAKAIKAGKAKVKAKARWG